MVINEHSPGAAALRAKIAATLLETLGPEAIDGDKAGALAQKAVAMLSSAAAGSAAGSANAAAPDPEALAASFSEFLEASVARDFTAWLLDHVGKHASDYGFFGEAAGGGGGVGDGGGGAPEEQRTDAGAGATAAAAAAAQSFRGGRGRGGFARGGGRGFAGRGRGRGLGVSRGGAAAAGVSKASSSSRSVFDRLGAGAAGAAADAAAAEAASGGGGDSAMTAADAAGERTTTTTADDPARLKLLREELVRLRQEAIKVAAAASTTSTAPDISSLAAGRTVLVKNVHFDATDASLAEHFRAAGLAVERATVARAGAGRGPSKGYGVVLLLSVEGARRALALAGSTLEGRAIDVVPARPTGIALEGGVVASFRGRGRGGRRGGRGAAAGTRGRGGRFSSSSFSYVRPELAAERAAEAAAARRAALDAELDAFARGKGG